MAARTRLQVVPPGTRRRRETPKSITEAIDGSSRDVLAAMRVSLARKLDADEVASNAISSAYTKLHELDRLIRAMDAAEDDERPVGAKRDDTFDASAI